METTTQTSKTTAKDFFLWAGAVIALYGSIASFITLLFEYINYAFPDALAYYGDPYGGAVRTAMAALIVLVPTTIILLRIIRGSIVKEAGKAGIWVRKWALGLTVFVAVVTILADLMTLITTFLGGEISMRFVLKVAVVLLVALGVLLHFIADQRGYWLAHVKKANVVGVGVGILVLAAIISGFFIIGTPGTLRLLRFDEQKVSDLQNIQYQVVNYYQQKAMLPKTLEEMNDSLSGFVVPTDAQSGVPYHYEKTGNLSFSLCATFNEETRDTRGQGAYGGGKDMAYPSMGMGIDENFKHGAGEVCFARTIDPDRYPIFEKPMIR